MNKINFYPNKILYLTNILIFQVEDLEHKFDQNLILLKMKSYIMACGAEQVGPLIQHTIRGITEFGDSYVRIEFILQCSKYISAPEAPYLSMENLVVNNSMYVRYFGPQGKMNLAFSKIYLEAFENDIEVAEENYIVFLNDDQDDIMVDLFIPKKEER